MLKNCCPAGALAALDPAMQAALAALMLQTSHPAVPIAAVADAAPQPLLAGHVLQVEDTNEIILAVGADGKLRARRRLYAAKLRYSGSLGPMAPNASLLIPFDTLVYNVGNAGVTGAAAGFVAPFDCIVHVDAAAFFNYEAWLQGHVAGPGAGSVAAVTAVYKNGVLEEQVGIDYAIKGGLTVGGTANEFKFPSGGVDVLCATGDLVQIHAGNGQSSGNSHSIFYAYATFHVVGAI